MCNMSLQHLGESIELLVSKYVTLGILCNQCVEWLIRSYNTLITFRVSSGAMFMLTKITKLPFQMLLTKFGPLE
jgi:hypothetical protein